MNPYIADTSYSTSALIRLIFEEEYEIEMLSQERDSLLRKAEFYYKAFSSKDMQEDFDEIRVMYDFGQMAKARKEADEVQAQINVLEASIDVKDFSLGALSGALLQIAKQGISLTHGGLSACPSGRSIGSESLKNVIWQARNQSMHFEEGNLHRRVRLCFQNLENDFGAQFSLATNPPLNLARHVVRLLEWGDYTQYEKDMGSII